MARGKRSDEWDRCSLLAAVTFNAFRGEGDPPRSAADFNPFIPKEAEKPRRSISDPKALAAMCGVKF
jgi:hypothetical protein